MTLSDPLLKELKGHIGVLVASGPGPYTDDDEPVFSICHTLESIFQKGLVRHDGFTPWRTDCFQWFHQLVRKYNRVLPLTFRGAFDDIMSDQKTKTNSGKTRLLIRHCLRRRCLHTPMQFHVENRDYEDTNLRVNYNPHASVLGHEILSQILLSLLLQLSHYEFIFDLSNSSFLDESWQIPKLFKTELVPCDKLGLTLGFPMGFAVIVAILENSVAAELSDKIEIGDILDDFNGTPVRHFYGSKIETLFKKCRKQPFRLTFIKSKDPVSSEIFLPAIKLYRILGMDPELLNYPEPAYRRHAKSLVNAEFEESFDNEGCSSDCDINGDMKSNSRADTTKEPESREGHLIDVDVTGDKENIEESSSELVNSNYLDLLSSLVEPSISTIDLLTSDIPDLFSHTGSTPAQLILEPNANGECASTSEDTETGDVKKTKNLDQSLQQDKVNDEASKYYDDSNPFLV